MNKEKKCICLTCKKHRGNPCNTKIKEIKVIKGIGVVECGEYVGDDYWISWYGCGETNV